jgi:2-polyprenyl-6-methoxyphenol hydroxylase-like FAD-dependent oxidoreductase
VRTIIIGGGIGGLCAAIALRSRGIDAEVYEKSAVHKEVGAGISLWPNAVKALVRLGLGDALDSINFAPEHFALRRQNGATISVTDSMEMKNRFGSGVTVLHRADLLAMLAERLGTDHIHLGHECSGFDEDQNGVAVKFTNSEAVKGDILIGADGIRSAVKTLLGHHDPLRYSGYTAWRGVAQFDHSNFTPGETWGRGKRFGMLPIQNGRVYWYATANVPEHESDPPEGPEALLLSLFRAWHEPIEKLIRATGAIILRHDVYDRRPLRSWGRGRVTLLGDAAHPMTPNLGQGACQGIEDAMELARQLAVGPDIERSLRTYEAARIPRTARIVVESRRLGAIGQWNSLPLCWLRDLAFSVAPKSAALRSFAPIIAYEEHLAD